jgi:trimethylamine--corrinoid protein Co-methyltransferase
MRILAEIGMQIENDDLLRALADFGLPVDFSTQRVRFPNAIVERFLGETPKYDWENAERWVGGTAGIYHGRFHDPETGELAEWDERSLAYYFSLARGLSHVGGALMLGCRLPVPAPLEPLYERLYCWKYGGTEGSSIYLDETCPHLYDLYQARAAQQAKTVQEVFRGTVYLIPALKLGRHEAYQVAYFRERGLRVGIGDMFALGANAPVTLAGSVALNIAEQLALRILDWAWFGLRRLQIGGSLSVMDMRTMIYPYGRPEMALANLMIAQMARFYGASFHGHAGLSDAKLPSVEAGYQKALTAIPTLMACGGLWMDPGLLSIDEVCSPIQLILDNEFMSVLKYMAQEFQVDDESIGFDTILEAGPGGQYLDKDHTVKFLRREHWQPKIWSREMLHPWMNGSRALDLDRAREIAVQARRDLDPGVSHISPEFEKEILRIIKHAGQVLA